MADGVNADIQATLDAARADGLIDAGDENALIRHADGRANELKEALDRIATEYQSRVRDDGQSNADQWLAATAEAMGRRDGEETRQLLSSIAPQ